MAADYDRRVRVTTTVEYWLAQPANLADVDFVRHAILREAEGRGKTIYDDTIKVRSSDDALVFSYEDEKSTSVAGPA